MQATPLGYFRNPGRSPASLVPVEMCELSELSELSPQDAVESLSVKGAMGGVDLSLKRRRD
jgi:hypothetical protein